jgi:hypothetical protein
MEVTAINKPDQALKTSAVPKAVKREASDSGKRMTLKIPRVGNNISGSARNAALREAPAQA